MSAAPATSQLDIEQPDALARYLRETGRIGAGEQIVIRTLAGGVSNRTVLVERPSGESWVLKQALAKLRVAVDWFSDPARIEREALGLRWIGRLTDGATPALVFEDPAHHLLAMAAVPEPHENWKSMLLAGRVELGHVGQFGTLLGTIHRRSAESAEPLREIFDDRSYFETLRLEPYYAYAAEQLPEARPFLLKLIDDTRARRLALVHGDYSPKNVLVREGGLILLDHEVIHWGDPAFDVGFALTHLVCKLFHLGQAAPDILSAPQWFVRCYGEEVPSQMWNAAQQAMAGRHLLGCIFARIAGRSPMDYLTSPERGRLLNAALNLLAMGQHEPLPVKGMLYSLLMRSFDDGND